MPSGATPARNAALFAGLLGLLAAVGMIQSWTVALTILNLSLISAIMSLGLNVQWGYTGLFNFGTMGFVALGGLAAVLVSAPPVPEAWQAGGLRVLAGLLTGAGTIVAAVALWKRMAPGRLRWTAMVATLAAGLVAYRLVFDPAVAAIEAVNPASTGFLGGLGLPVMISWPVGGLLAAAAAWIVGKTALGLRSDYLGIATFGIAEIVIFVIKNEDWLSRGVKNVVGLPRPVAYEVDLQASADFVEWARRLGMDPVDLSSVHVKLSYAILFAVVLLIVLWLAQKAVHSPWGRMMRAIRDNEVAAEAMGKDVTARHLQVFVLGSAICGIAGAMLTTLDGQLTPGSYQPLRFTFLIWVMVIVGGSGNNLGAVLGGMLIWFLWVEVEPMGLWLMNALTADMPEGSGLRRHLVDSAAYMRPVVMGAILLLVLRFWPRGLIPGR